MCGPSLVLFSRCREGEPSPPCFYFWTQPTHSPGVLTGAAYVERLLLDRAPHGDPATPPPPSSPPPVPTSHALHVPPPPGAAAAAAAATARWRTALAVDGARTADALRGGDEGGREAAARARQPPRPTPAQRAAETAAAAAAAAAPAAEQQLVAALLAPPGGGRRRRPLDDDNDADRRSPRDVAFKPRGEATAAFDGAAAVLRLRR